MTTSMAASAGRPARRTVQAWLLYDFANSAYVAVIPATVYSKYYALTVVGNDRGQGDFWWGLAVTVSMVLVAVLSPCLGAIADRAGARKRFLAWFTYLSVAATALMATVGPGDVVWGFVLAVVATVGFEAGLVFYNAYLPELAPPEGRGRLSAHGFACGYAGSALALLAALPFALRDSFGATFLIAAGLFGVFALPAMRYLPADPPGRLPVAGAARHGIEEALRTLRGLARTPDLRGFLLAYLFFEDGVNTVVYFSAVFAGHTLGFTTTEVIGLYFAVQLSALAGAWLWARPIDRWGPKRIIQITLIQWCLVVLATYFVTTKGEFYVVAIFAGSGLGAIQAAARAFMASLIPPGREAELFGFYSLCGKTAAVMGPVIFGGVSRLTGGNQRAAILAVGVMFIIGLALLGRVQAGGPSPVSSSSFSPEASS